MIALAEQMAVRSRATLSSLRGLDYICITVFCDFIPAGPDLLVRVSQS